MTSSSDSRLQASSGRARPCRRGPWRPGPASDAALAADRPAARRVSSDSAEEGLGLDVAVEGRDQPAVDGGGGRAGQLLVGDGPDQDRKMALLRRPEMDGAGRRHQRGHHGDPLGQHLGGGRGVTRWAQGRRRSARARRRGVVAIGASASTLSGCRTHARVAAHRASTHPMTDTGSRPDSTDEAPAGVRWPFDRETRSHCPPPRRCSIPAASLTSPPRSTDPADYKTMAEQVLLALFIVIPSSPCWRRCRSCG